MEQCSDHFYSQLCRPGGSQKVYYCLARWCKTCQQLYPTFRQNVPAQFKKIAKSPWKIHFSAINEKRLKDYAKSTNCYYFLCDVAKKCLSTPFILIIALYFHYMFMLIWWSLYWHYLPPFRCSASHSLSLWLSSS